MATAPCICSWGRSGDGWHARLREIVGGALSSHCILRHVGSALGQKTTIYPGFQMGTKIKVGDLIAIPSGAYVGLAKVIYVSSYFRQVVLLKLYRVAFQEQERHFPCAEASANLYYTSSGPIFTGRWTVTGFEPMSECECLLSRRIVASDIWVGDECLGQASEHDLETLPKMLVYGFKLIEKAVARLAEVQNSSKT